MLFHIDPETGEVRRIQLASSFEQAAEKFFPSPFKRNAASSSEFLQAVGNNTETVALWKYDTDQLMLLDLDRYTHANHQLPFNIQKIHSFDVNKWLIEDIDNRYFYTNYQVDNF